MGKIKELYQRGRAWENAHIPVPLQIIICAVIVAIGAVIILKQQGVIK